MMAALRYKHTSKVSPARTAGEITALLIRLGATDIRQRIEHGEIAGVDFIVSVRAGGSEQELSYRMPIRWRGIYDQMLAEWEGQSRRRKLGQREVTDKLNNMIAQAKRSAWRIALEWLRVQMAFVETGGRNAVEVFMADMIVPGKDVTVGELVVTNGVRALLPG